MVNEINAPRVQAVTAPSTGWQIAWGVLLIICGILAVAMPGVAALATALVFAWLLIFGGGCEIAYAIQTRDKDVCSAVIRVTAHCCFTMPTMRMPGLPQASIRGASHPKSTARERAHPSPIDGGTQTSGPPLIP
jgi:uncharacterized membrane protein HdeD (DUF308 family)